MKVTVQRHWKTRYTKWNVKHVQKKQIQETGILKQREHKSRHAEPPTRSLFLLLGAQMPEQQEGAARQDGKNYECPNGMRGAATPMQPKHKNAPRVASVTCSPKICAKRGQPVKRPQGWEGEGTTNNCEVMPKDSQSSNPSQNTVICHCH